MIAARFIFLSAFREENVNVNLQVESYRSVSSLAGVIPLPNLLREVNQT